MWGPWCQAAYLSFPCEIGRAQHCQLGQYLGGGRGCGLLCPHSLRRKGPAGAPLTGRLHQCALSSATSAFCPHRPSALTGLSWSLQISSRGTARGKSGALKPAEICKQFTVVAGGGGLWLPFKALAAPKPGLLPAPWGSSLPALPISPICPGESKARGREPTSSETPGPRQHQAGWGKLPGSAVALGLTEDTPAEVLRGPLC